MGSDKTYYGTTCLGIATDSQDAQGAVISESDCSNITREQFEGEMRKFSGDIFQTPPMVSAVKVNGTPLYKSARKGKVVEREPRLIHIYEFKLLEFDLPKASFFLRCTKGTYVRTICSDIGDALKCGAHLTDLRRTKSGEFDVSEAVPLNDILEMEKEDLISRIIPMERMHKYNFDLR
jgi:tRNA pseudouridine55 synthase